MGVFCLVPKFPNIADKHMISLHNETNLTMEHNQLTYYYYFDKILHGVFVKTAITMPHARHDKNVSN